MSEEEKKEEVKEKPKRKHPQNPRNFSKTYDGSSPLQNTLHEEAIQYALANPTFSKEVISAKFEKNPLWFFRMLRDSEPFYKRYIHLQNEAAKRNLMSREEIIKKIELETESPHSNIRLKALEMLCKTKAMFTENIKHEILPRRLIIRSTDGSKTEIRGENDVDSPKDDRQ